MNFASVLFLFFFLPISLLVYFASPRFLRLIMLTLLSYAFYAWSDPRFVLLLLWTTVVDYSAGNTIGGAWSRSGRAPDWLRKLVLMLSLCNSIGLLLLFKYAAFGQSLVISAVSLFGYAGWSVRHLVLPAGISFYTFESISYVIDIYRGDIAPAVVSYLPSGGRSLRSRLTAEARALVGFACFLAEFPHLIAGPIIRYQEIAPQLHRPRLSLTRNAQGVMMFAMGLAKKVLIADTLAGGVEAVFSAGQVRPYAAWAGVIAFAFQIYFDFSGYTDMACGLAMMLGFRFPRNFHSPYRSVSVSEFWRRWHMTLSRWLRDYVYFPLGGSRAGVRRTYFNLFMTMLIAGIWHGAGMPFVIWGAYHGACLVVERWFGTRRVTTGLRGLGWRVFTFFLVCVGWIMFRSQTVMQAFSLMHDMVWPSFLWTGVRPANIHFGSAHWTAFYGAVAITIFGIETQAFCRRLSAPRATVAIACFCLSVFVICVRSATPFLYFKF